MLEAHLHKRAAAWNNTALLAHTQKLQRSVGADLLHTPLAHVLLGTEEPASRVCVALTLRDDNSICVALTVKTLDAWQEPGPAKRAEEVEAEVAAVCARLVDVTCAACIEGTENQGSNLGIGPVATTTSCVEGPQKSFLAPKPGGCGAAEAAAQQSRLIVQVSAATTASGLERRVLGPFPWPLYFIGTRDCFTYNLVQRRELARLIHSA